MNENDYSRKWLDKLFSGRTQTGPYFRTAYSQILESNETLVPGSAFDDVNSATNICFINCRELDFPGAAFFRTEPKKIIYLCSEYFDYPLQRGEWRSMEQIVADITRAPL